MGLFLWWLLSSCWGVNTVCCVFSWGVMAAGKSEEVHGVRADAKCGEGLQTAGEGTGPQLS